jgi:hypothetical protein
VATAIPPRTAICVGDMSAGSLDDDPYRMTKVSLTSRWRVPDPGAALPPGRPRRRGRVAAGPLVCVAGRCAGCARRWLDASARLLTRKPLPHPMISGQR